jgi:dimethylamine monooxygenase subunit A
MRELPAQVVHRPFEPGPYRMAMDLVAVPEAAWFELDDQYRHEMTERQRLLETAHTDVFAATPISHAARYEALDLIAAALTTHHPDWFSRDGQTLRNHLTRETWNLTALTLSTASTLSQAPTLSKAATLPKAPTLSKAATLPKAPTLSVEFDPLELAGRLVQEDLCLIQNSEDGPVFTAAVLCFPSRWRLMDKIGKPLSAVHQPVPLYADRLARPVDRFMRHLKPGHIAQRLNWSLLDDPTLFQPGGKWRQDDDSPVTVQNAGSQVFLRVERQTLRRLPNSGAVLFGIRVHVYPLHQVIDRPDRAAALAQAVQVLPPEVQHYKSLLPFKNALLNWLHNPPP